jgi:hypothetical protein
MKVIIALLFLSGMLWVMWVTEDPRPFRSGAASPPSVETSQAKWCRLRGGTGGYGC